MSNMLYKDSQVLAKVVGLSAMASNFAKQLEFSYRQEFQASFDNVSIEFQWDKEGDISTLSFVILGHLAKSTRILFKHKLFDYNTDEDSVFYNTESLQESLFESSKGYVNSDPESSDFKRQVAENGLRYDLSEIIDNYIMDVSQQMGEKALN
jgi:hypothetical protein